MSSRYKEKHIDVGKVLGDLVLLGISLAAISVCNEWREQISQNIDIYYQLAATHGKVIVDAMVGSGSDFGYTMLAVSGFGLLKHTVLREFESALDVLTLAVTGGFAFLELGEIGNPILQQKCIQTGVECGSCLDMLIYSAPTVAIIGKHVAKWWDGPQIGG